MSNSLENVIRLTRIAIGRSSIKPKHIHVFWPCQICRENQTQDIIMIFKLNNYLNVFFSDIIMIIKLISFYLNAFPAFWRFENKIRGQYFNVRLTRPADEKNRILSKIQSTLAWQCEQPKQKRPGHLLVQFYFCPHRPPICSLPIACFAFALLCTHLLVFFHAITWEVVSLLAWQLRHGAS